MGARYKDAEAAQSTQEAVRKIHSRARRWVVWTVVGSCLATMAIAGLLLGLYLTGNISKDDTAQKVNPHSDGILGTSQGRHGGMFKDSFNTILDELAGFAPTTHPPTAPPTVDPALLMIAAKETDVFDRVKDVVQDTADTVIDAAKNTVEFVVDPIGNAMEVVNDVAETMADSVGNVMDGVGDATETVADNVDDVIDVVNDAADTVADHVEDVMDVVSDAAETVADHVEDMMDVFSDAAETVADNFEDVLDEINDAAETDADSAEDVIDNVRDSIEDAVDALKDRLDDITDDSHETVGELINDLSEQRDNDTSSEESDVNDDSDDGNNSRYDEDVSDDPDTSDSQESLEVSANVTDSDSSNEINDDSTEIDMESGSIDDADSSETDDISSSEGVLRVTNSTVKSSRESNDSDKNPQGNDNDGDDEDEGLEGVLSHSEGSSNSEDESNTPGDSSEDDSSQSHVLSMSANDGATAGDSDNDNRYESIKVTDADDSSENVDDNTREGVQSLVSDMEDSVRNSNNIFENTNNDSSEDSESTLGDSLNETNHGLKEHEEEDRSDSMEEHNDTIDKSRNTQTLISDDQSDDNDNIDQPHRTLDGSAERVLSLLNIGSHSDDSGDDQTGSISQIADLRNIVDVHSSDNTRFGGDNNDNTDSDSKIADDRNDSGERNSPVALFIAPGNDLENTLGRAISFVNKDIADDSVNDNSGERVDTLETEDSILDNLSVQSLGGESKERVASAVSDAISKEFIDANKPGNDAVDDGNIETVQAAIAVDDRNDDSGEKITSVVSFAESRSSDGIDDTTVDDERSRAVGIDSKVTTNVDAARTEDDDDSSEKADYAAKRKMPSRTPQPVRLNSNAFVVRHIATHLNSPTHSDENDDSRRKTFLSIPTQINSRSSPLPGHSFSNNLAIQHAVAQASISAVTVDDNSSLLETLLSLPTLTNDQPPPIVPVFDFGAFQPDVTSNVHFSSPASGPIDVSRNKNPSLELFSSSIPVHDSLTQTGLDSFGFTGANSFDNTGLHSFMSSELGLLGHSATSSNTPELSSVSHSGVDLFGTSGAGSMENTGFHPTVNHEVGHFRMPTVDTSGVLSIATQAGGLGHLGHLSVAHGVADSNFNVAAISNQQHAIQTDETGATSAENTYGQASNSHSRTQWLDD